MAPARRLHYTGVVYEVLDELGVRAGLLAPQQLSDLDELGYCRFDGFLRPEQVEAAMTAITTLLAGRQVGTLHLTDLLEVGRVFDPLWLRPRLLAAVRHLLGPEFRIDGVSHRACAPGLACPAPHVDAPDHAGPGRWQVCNAVVALSDFTDRNGAIRVVPGSHLGYGFQRPAEHEDHPDQVLLLGPPGTMWLLNSHLYHSGTRNETARTRHAVVTTFHRRGGAALLGQEPSEGTMRRLGSAAYLLM